jgi:hypothetical protein
MFDLKLSTTFEDTFFAHDVNGDAVTGKVDGNWTKSIRKQGETTFTAMTVTITEVAKGFYRFTISTTHSNTVGRLDLVFEASGVKQVNLKYTVKTRLTDDLAFPAVSGRSSAIDASGRHLADVDTIKTNPVVNAGTVTFPTTATLASTTNITAGTVTTATNVTTVNGLAANVITAASINADAIQAAKIQAGALNGKGDWNIGKTGYSLTVTTGLGNQTANITGNLSGSVGSLTTNNDKTGYSLTATTGLGNQTANITGNLVGNVTGDVNGKVVGGGATALTGTGVRAVDGAGNAIAPAATALTNATWTDAKAAFVDVSINSRLAAASYTAPDNASIAAILVDTDELELTLSAGIASRANTPTLIGLLDIPDVADVNQNQMAGRVADEVLTGATHNIVNSLGRRIRQLQAGAQAFSGTITGTPTTTVVQLAGSPSSTNDFYKPGLIIVESSFGVQFRRIFSYDGGTEEVTVSTPFTTVPVSGDLVTIIPWATVRVSEMDTDVLEAVTIKADAADKLADHMLRRTYANARQSADGDAVAFRSLLGAVGKLVNKWDIAGSTLTVYQEDDVTATAPGGTQTVTGTPGAAPITTLDTV